ncbi:U-box domain-containing protein [Drosera capensis]
MSVKLLFIGEKKAACSTALENFRRVFVSRNRRFRSPLCSDANADSSDVRLRAWNEDQKSIRRRWVMESVETRNARTSSTILIALDGNIRYKHIVEWALKKFGPEGNVAFKLLHVYPKIRRVPTEMGNLIPVSHVRDNIVLAYKKEVALQRRKMLLPFQEMCKRVKVHVETSVIESDDTVKAISDEIVKASCDGLVIGASRNGLKSKRRDLSSVISRCAPSVCTVYIISRGKLKYLRPADACRFPRTLQQTSFSKTSTSTSSGYRSYIVDHTDASSMFSKSFPPLDRRLDGSFQSTKHLTTIDYSGPLYVEEDETSATCNVLGGGGESGTDGVRSSKTCSYERQISISDQLSSAGAPSLSSSEDQMQNLMEFQKLKGELLHVQELLAKTENETCDATRQISELFEQQLEEKMRLMEIIDREEKAKELAKLEREKAQAASHAAHKAWESAQKEAYQRKYAEQKAIHEAKEAEKLKTVFMVSKRRYQHFTKEEIVSATSSFSPSLRIGSGSFGTVYKCELHHTTVAVKILDSEEGSESKQFHQELEILSGVCHPHLLLLLGACLEESCIVYEYMQNGNLEDMLLRKDDKPCLPWFDRIRIAWEVASALVFLHNARPRPIIHRDLKPANILLDHNLVSKIGDAGLSTLLDPNTSTIYKDTNPAGTLCYIDPEYQRTGLVCTKSDVYAFGIVVLQLLTSKPAIAITRIVEEAIDEGCLMQIVDKEAGPWPPNETCELACLGLKCAGLYRKDRPDLKDQVLPALERLNRTAVRAQEQLLGVIADGLHSDSNEVKDLEFHDRKRHQFMFHPPMLKMHKMFFKVA